MQEKRSPAPAAKAIGRALTSKRNARRPIYMVLRQMGFGPETTVHALFSAGLAPKLHSVSCSALAADFKARLVDELGKAIWRGEWRA